jgi:primosomal protein N''
MKPDDERVERMLVLTRRLADALHADIAALDRGHPLEMRTIVPETQQLLSHYAREAAGLRTQARLLPQESRAKLIAETEKLHEALALHERRLSRVRRAGEGMIRAIVDDVERRKRVTRTYAPRPSARPASSNAMLYNGVA